MIALKYKEDTFITDLLQNKSSCSIEDCVWYDQFPMKCITKCAIFLLQDSFKEIPDTL